MRSVGLREGLGVRGVLRAKSGMQPMEIKGTLKLQKIYEISLGVESSRLHRTLTQIHTLSRHQIDAPNMRAVTCEMVSSFSQSHQLQSKDNSAGLGRTIDNIIKFPILRNILKFLQVHKTKMQL
mgnify:CR=1 FL=1